MQRLNVPARKITISHQAVPTIGMPAMTMTFAAADRATLALLQRGDPVGIRVENRNGAMDVVNFRVQRATPEVNPPLCNYLVAIDDPYCPN